jgi:hypothetical protein
MAAEAAGAPPMIASFEFGWDRHGLEFGEWLRSWISISKPFYRSRILFESLTITSDRET